MHLIFVVLVV